MGYTVADPGTVIDVTPLENNSAGSSGSNLTNTSAFQAFDVTKSALGAGSFLEKSGFKDWVENSWIVMRQLSNIMVMLFLFIASVATTLNIQVGVYGVKRMLPSIIVATILANFSMLFIKILVDLEVALRGGVISLGSEKSGIAGVTDMFIKLLKPMYLAITAIVIGSGMQYLVAGMGITCLVVIVFIILGMVMLITWVRSYVLAVLVIFAPLAFIAMGAPFTQGAFRKWWGEFMKWLILPTVQFFVLSLGAVLVQKTTTGGFTLVPFVIMLGTLYAALRVPFMIGGAVATVGGYITNNVITRGAKQAAGENAQIIGHLTPGVGDAMRYFPQSTANRQKLLAGLRQRPVGTAYDARKKALDEGIVASSRRRAAQAMIAARKEGKNAADVNAARDAVLNSREVLAAQARLARPNNAAYTGLLSGWARRQAAAGIRADQVSIDAQNRVNVNRGHALATDEALRERLAKDDFLKEYSEAQIEEQKLKANDDYRQSNRSLSLALAMTQERSAGLKEKLEGLAASMKAVALGADQEVAALRRQGILQKELGTAGYAKKLSQMKYELRKSGKNEITAALEGNEQNRQMVEELLGPGFGQPGSVMKKALISLVGGKKSLESAVESAEKSEMLTYTNNQMAGIGAIYDGLNKPLYTAEEEERIRSATDPASLDPVGYGKMMEDKKKLDTEIKALWDHSYSEDQKGEFIDKWHDAFSRMTEDRQQNILDFLGIAHLSQEEQDDKIFELLSKDEASLRKTSVVGGMKALGEYESGRYGFIRDASRAVVEGSYAAATSKVEKVLPILAAGSIHTDAGMSMINQLHNEFGKEGDTAMDTWQSHLGAMATTRAVDKWVVDPSRSEADVLKALDHTNPNSIASVTNKHVDAYNATAAAGERAQKIDDSFRIHGLKIQGHASEPVTLAHVKQVLRGESGAPVLTGSNGESLKNQDIMRAVRTALSSNIEPVHRTGQSIVGDVSQVETS